MRCIHTISRPIIARYLLQTKTKEKVNTVHSVENALHVQYNMVGILTARTQRDQRRNETPLSVIPLRYIAAAYCLFVDGKPLLIRNLITEYSEIYYTVFS